MGPWPERSQTVNISKRVMSAKWSKSNPCQNNREYLKESYERNIIQMEPWPERDQTVNILKTVMTGK